MKNLLNEAVSDLVARFYEPVEEELHGSWNAEANHYAKKNSERYSDQDSHSIVTKTREEKVKYSNKPVSDQRQSAGYRGLQYARKRSGHPSDPNVQGRD